MTAIEDGAGTSDRRRPLMRRLLVDAALVLGLVAAVGLAVVVAMVHIHFMRVVSPSMAPSIGVGDVVLLKEHPASELSEGQIVVLPVPDEGGVMYVHRLASVRQVEGRTVVTTKGDANPAADPWELTIESASVPLVVGQIPMPGALAGLGGANLTRFLLAVMLALIAAPMLVGVSRRTRVGTRLRALPARLSDRRHR